MSQKLKKCPTCDGEGNASDYLQADPEDINSIALQKILCPKCNGSGFIPDYGPVFCGCGKVMSAVTQEGCPDGH